MMTTRDRILSYLNDHPHTTLANLQTAAGNPEDFAYTIVHLENDPPAQVIRWKHPHGADTYTPANPTTPSETPDRPVYSQPIEGWLTEVNTGEIHPRRAVGSGTPEARERVAAAQELLVALIRGFNEATLGADRDYPEEAEQIDPGVVVDQLAETIGYRREGDRMVKVASNEGENREPPRAGVFADRCVCGHNLEDHVAGPSAQPCAAYASSPAEDCPCPDYRRVPHLSEPLLDVGMRSRLREGWGQYAEQTPVADRLVVTPPWGHWVHDRVTIDAEHGVRVEGKDGEVFHMPAEGGMHRDVAGKPCKADPLVVALGSYLNDATAALDVVAWLADRDLLANPPERA